MIDITESLLIRLAGVRAFGQGLSRYDEGGVQNVVTTGRLTKAIVQERGSHKVVLRHSHSMIEGECDCEASGGIDFCQHCVAVAFSLQDASSTKRPATKRQAMTAIRRHMAALSREELLERFMNLIGQNHALRDDLFQKAWFASGGQSFADLKRMLRGPTARSQGFSNRRPADQRLQKAVAGQTVGAVEPRACNLATRPQARHRGPPFRIRHHPAHVIVSGRRHWNRLPFELETVVPTQLHYGGKSIFERFG